MEKQRESNIISFNGVSTPDLMININAQGTGTLTGANVDPIISGAKADWCVEFRYEVWRNLNQNVSNTSSYGSGQLVAGEATVLIYPTAASIYAETSLFQGTAVPTISVYRVNDMNGVLTVVEEWDFTNNTFTGSKLRAQTGANGTGLANLYEFVFQYQQIQHTVKSYNAETFAAIGSNVSLANFSTGTLAPAASGGGGGDTGGGGGGDAGGGGGGGAPA
ncbi:MAG: hypothetical protein K2P93_08005 [Alphaproteobacteria bacterium]|nr:hypothetical protein [Alphaproteobacteria bacterium]